MYRVALFAAGLAAFILSSLALYAPARAIEAYIFRGAGDFTFIADGLTFSQGMDDLGKQFERQGVKATVYRWQAVDWAYRDIMKRRPDAVAIMGHSMGALASITLATKLKGTGVRVAYMGLIDIPGPGAVAPSNVEVAENFYSMFPVYGMLGKTKGASTKVSNQFIFGQIHTTMDNSRKVQTTMLATVAKFQGAGSQPVTQAFAADDGTDNSTLTARVDRVLTASTREQGVDAASTHNPGLLTAPVEVQAPTQIAFAQALPERIPVPTPRPRVHDTRTGLPPIE